MLWDIAGSKNYRRVWHSYIPDAHLIVFMIDGAALLKIQDTEESLKEMISDQSIEQKTVLFLINKNV